LTIKKDYPILEFDCTKEAVIEPHKLFGCLDIPERCVITFFKDVIDRLKEAGKLKIVKELRSEAGMLPVYEMENGGERLVVYQGFPAIIHAVLDINEIQDHIIILKELLIKLGHKQLIIHPVCKSEPITYKTIHKLAYNMQKVVERLKPCGITVFIENNSKLDPIFTSHEELKIIFLCVPELEFILDIAHMDSIEHVKELVLVKMP